MRRHIFSINSGRSGSEYLATVLGTAQSVASYHEPKPDGAGRRITRYPVSRPSLVDRLMYVPMYGWKMRKVRAIRRTIAELPAGVSYAESNHMFILAFWDVVMNSFDPVDVILLRRHLPAGVRSFIQLDHFTPQCPYTAFWFTSPNAPSRAATPLGTDEEMDQVDRIIAYLVDIEARAQRFKKRFPDTRVVEVRLEELNQIGKVRDMFAALGLKETPATAEIVGRVVNDKPEHKKKVGKTVSLEYCRERIEQYVEKCRSKGIEVPALPHLDDVPRTAPV